LQGELIKLQDWVERTGAKVAVIFEGRATAGKGGVIKRITQRHVPHLPSGGEIVLFDRSWYNRSGVERVMGFATPEQIESPTPLSAFHDIGVGAHEAILPQPVGTRLIGTFMPAIGDDRAIPAG